MNVENINRVIEFAKTRSWHSDGYLANRDCMVGIVFDALRGDRDWLHNKAMPGPHYLAEELGISQDNAEYLFLMYDSEQEYKHDWDKFINLPLDQQNEVIVKVLTTLRDTGLVTWPLPPNSEEDDEDECECECDDE